MRAAPALAVHARHRLPVPRGDGCLGFAVEGHRCLPDVDRDAGFDAAARRRRQTGQRPEAGGCNHDRADRRRALPGQSGQPALGTGRHAGRPGARAAVPGTRVRVRHAALRHRQPQRRQRRIHLLPPGRAPRVLLRLLRQAATDDRDHHDQEAGRRRPGRNADGIPVQRRRSRSIRTASSSPTVARSISTAPAAQAGR